MRSGPGVRLEDGRETGQFSAGCGATIPAGQEPSSLVRGPLNPNIDLRSTLKLQGVCDAAAVAPTRSSRHTLSPQAFHVSIP
jgi:hypothetical protein